MSASRIATSETSGRSSPSRSRLTHHYVKHARSKIANDLDTLDRVDVRMQVAHLDAVLGQELGQVFGHALGQRGDQYPIALIGTQLDLRQHVVDLRACRAHLNLRIDQPGRAHQLFDHLHECSARRGGCAERTRAAHLRSNSSSERSRCRAPTAAGTKLTAFSCARDRRATAASCGIVMRFVDEHQRVRGNIRPTGRAHPASLPRYGACSFRPPAEPARSALISNRCAARCAGPRPLSFVRTCHAFLPLLLDASLARTTFWRGVTYATSIKTVKRGSLPTRPVSGLTLDRSPRHRINRLGPPVRVLAG